MRGNKVVAIRPLRPLPPGSGRKPSPVLDRFWSKVEKLDRDSCWAWKAGLTTEGYGQFRLPGRSGKMVRASRFSYELHYGPIGSKDIFVCHSCDNRACVNPAHLWLGTCADNMRDMAEKGRGAGRRLWREIPPLLTAETVRQIRIRFTAGESRGLIARELGVSRRTVYRIGKGEGRKDVG